MSLKGFGAELSALFEASSALDSEITYCLWRWYAVRCDLISAVSLSNRAWICLCCWKSASYCFRVGPMEVSWCLCAATAASYSALSELEGLEAMFGEPALGSGAGTVVMVGDWLDRCGGGHMG